MNKRLKISIAFVLCLVAVLLLNACSFISSKNKTSDLPAQKSLDSLQAGVLEESSPTDHAKEFQNNQFRVTASFGLGGVIKANNYMPVSLDIQNDGKEFLGTVRVIIPSPTEDGIAYEKEFAIAKGKRKSVVISVPSAGVTNYFYVEMVNQDGTVVMTQKVNTGSSQEYNQLFVGILSNDFNSLQYFDKVSVNTLNYGGNTRLVELNSQIFPSDSNSLNSLNYMIINNFDTDELTTNQFDALISWVEGGGTLILGTGFHYEGAVNQFPSDMITDVSTKQQKIRLVSEGDRADTLVTIVQDIQVKGAKTIDSIITGVSISKLNTGTGSIVVTGIDLGSKEMIEWKDRGVFAQKLFVNSLSVDSTNSLVNGGSYSSYDNNFWLVNNILNYFRNMKLPNIVIYIFVFIGYVLLVGPAGYFLLKKKDSREKIWIYIPIMSLLFYGLIFLISSDLRIEDTVATSFTTIRLSDDQKNETVYFTLQNPTGDPYAVTFNETCSNFSPMIIDNNIYDKSQIALENYNYKYLVGYKSNETQITFSKAKAFTKQRVMFSHNTSAKNKTFHINLKASLKSTSGSVTNTSGYDLSDAILYYNNKFVKLEDFDNGESVKISNDMFISARSSNSSQLSSMFLPLPNSKNDEDLLAYNEKNNVYQYFTNKYLEVNPYNVGYVFGLAKEFTSNYITSDMVSESGNALVFQSFTEDMSDISEYYVSDINKNTIYEINGDLDSGHSAMYGEQVDATYNLGDEYSFFSLLAQRSKDPVDVYALNSKTNQYEKIFDGYDMMNDQTLKLYLDDNNSLRLRYKTSIKEENNVVMLPIISALGRYK